MTSKTDNYVTIDGRISGPVMLLISSPKCPVIIITI